MSCPHCHGDDVIGPFEMDGIADGRYQVKGLWWLWCRVCKRHARIAGPALSP